MFNRLFNIFAVCAGLYCPTAFASGPYSILQGSTSGSVTHFTVVAHKDEDLNFFPKPAAVERVEQEGSDWVVYRLRIEDLQPDHKYQLRIYDSRYRLQDLRDFRTLDPARKTGRVALASCMMRQFHNPFMWNNLAKPENRPDVLLILGDAVYLDRARLLHMQVPSSTSEIWDGFIKTRQTLNLYKWKTLVPVISVWDDHDSGGDGSDGKYNLLPESREIYEAFFANDEIKGEIQKGPGLAKQFRLFGKNFIMLDSRSYRELDLQSPLYGRSQEDWVMKQVQPGANFILSGSQFFGGFIRKDSYEYYWPTQAKDFATRLRAVGDEKNATVVFGSGDVHFSEVQVLESSLLGYPTFEVTASSVHSFPGHFFWRPANPRRMQDTGTHNVLLLNFDKPEGFEFRVDALGWRGNIIFSHPIQVERGCQIPLL
jgi:alkaline phosphatase D